MLSIVGDWKTKGSLHPVRFPFGALSPDNKGFWSTFIQV